MQLNFDNIYVLNLDSRPDRYSVVSKRLDKLGLSYNRFMAIDGNDLEFKGQEPVKGSVENRFALACKRSHIGIIKDAQRNGYKQILILEDDVVPHKNFWDVIRDVSLPEWEMLYLGASQYNWKVKHEKGFYLAKDTKGAFAYALKSSSFGFVRKAIEDSVLSVDHVFSKIVQPKYYGKCFVVYPNLFIADVRDSDIRKGRNQKEHSVRMKWNIKNYPM